jgi:tetrahydromethanopterin S-methyltransferase subunit G
MTGEPMPAPDVTREDLKRVEERVEFVAQEVDGEKLLSRYILKQSRQNGDDLAAIKTRVDRIEEKVDRVESEMRGLRSEFNSSQERLPGVIAEVMREVLREP